jgi:hypothetical protein
MSGRGRRELEQQEQLHAQARRLVARIRLMAHPRCTDTERRFRGQHELEQLPAHQRHLDQRFAEGDTVARQVERFAQGAPQHASGAHAVGEPRHVDHVGHLDEAASRVTNEERDRALELDLAARHVARAELVLEAHDAVVVSAVGKRAGRGTAPVLAPPGAPWARDTT